jgi:RNA polymerase sigma-70 factor (ECF subfamily)
LLNSLRHGNEEAFVMWWLATSHPRLRLAQSIISNHAVAQEALQDTWMGVVRGVERFQGRSSFQTRLYAILDNPARSAGLSGHPERRSRPSTPSTRCASTPQAAGPTPSKARPTIATSASLPPPNCQQSNLPSKICLLVNDK